MVHLLQSWYLLLNFEACKIDACLLHVIMADAVQTLALVLL